MSDCKHENVIEYRGGRGDANRRCVDCLLIFFRDPKTLLPPELQEALRTRMPEDADALTRQFLEADEEEQADMLAFIRGGGPEQCRQLRLEHVEGIPAADQLESWLAE